MAGEFAICSKCFKREKDWTAWVHRKRESALMEAGTAMSYFGHTPFPSSLGQFRQHAVTAMEKHHMPIIHTEVFYTNSSVKARFRVQWLQIV